MNQKPKIKANKHIKTKKSDLKRIILDTNFLLIPYQFKVDIFSEIERICNFKYEIYVLDKTVKELEKIVNEQKGKNKEAARLGLTILKRKDLKIIPSVSQKSADEILIEMADNDTIIATQDSAVRKAVKEKLANVIFLRNKKYLVID
ncbi:MAG: nucleotide-binding protein [Candidatus Woesearchaeota archaeon]